MTPVKRHGSPPGRAAQEHTADDFSEADARAGHGVSRALRGRGAASNPDCRYDNTRRSAIDDGWAPDEEGPPPLRTTVSADRSRSVVTYNESPDIPFDRSINPYRGCEHGCIYCYARPSHAWLGWSPGLDFESRLVAKDDAAECLVEELRHPGYRCAPIALGTNTDPYQPVERERRITRRILEVLAGCDHPLTIVTKSSLVERDLDLLAPMAARGLAAVYLSVTTLERTLARRMEPRAAAPQRRLETLRALSAAGIPTGVMFAPVIPAVNDSELEAVLGAAAEAGACWAGYVLLRLPLEVRELFEEWLQAHLPLKAAHVMSLVRQTRDGREYRSGFGTRMTGTGAYADLLRQRFALAARRLGLDGPGPQLDGTRFVPPGRAGDQLSLL